MHAATYCSDGPGAASAVFCAKFTVRPAAIPPSWVKKLVIAVRSYFNGHASNVTDRGRHDIARMHRTDAFRRPG